MSKKKFDPNYKPRKNYTKGRSKLVPTPEGTHPTRMYPVCGGKRKDGGICMQIAGKKTDHLGTGRCWLHGGSRQIQQIKHGRYSTIKSTRIKDLMKRLEEQDPDPYNLAEDLLLIRALAIDYINRYDEITEALLAWHQSWLTGDGSAPKPRKIIDLADAARLVKEATAVVKMIHDIRESQSIPMKVFQRLMVEMASVVTRHVAGDLLGEIEREWSTIRIEDKLLPGLTEDRPVEAVAVRG